MGEIETNTGDNQPARTVKCDNSEEWEVAITVFGGYGVFISDDRMSALISYIHRELEDLRRITGLEIFVSGFRPLSSNEGFGALRDEEGTLGSP